MKPPALDPSRAALGQALGLAELLGRTAILQDLLPLLEPLLAELRCKAGVLPGVELVQPDTFDASFEGFWEAYPVKSGKRAAREAARRAIRRPEWPGWLEARAALDAQKESARWQSGTIPNGDTWFNQSRWEDDPATMSAVGNGNGNGRRATDNPPAGYPLTEAERRAWPNLDKYSRQLLLENASIERERRLRR